MPEQLGYFITGSFWYGLLHEDNDSKTIFVGNIEPKGDGSFSGKISDRYGDAEIVCTFNNSALTIAKQYVGEHAGCKTLIKYHLSNEYGYGYFGWFGLCDEREDKTGWATCVLIPKDELYKRQKILDSFISET